MLPWMVTCSSTLLLLLTGVVGQIQSRYAHGVHRSGKKLLGPQVLREHHASSRLHCLFLCETLPTCSAINFNTVSTGINCHMFEEPACPNHELVDDLDVHYYDVYEVAPLETSTSFWDASVCVEDGYCSPYCAAENAGDACFGDEHCISSSMAPPGSYSCSGRTCQVGEDFWEVRPGLALPRWMDWTLLPWMKGFKKLKAGTCSLEIKLKLGAGARVELQLSDSQRETQTRLKFRIGLTTTDLLSYTENHHSGEDEYYDDEEGAETAVISGADTTGMVSAETESLLKLSWCEGTMSIGPVDNPTLVSGEVTGDVGGIAYLLGTSSGPESHLKLAQDVADAWLFEEDGTNDDAVFSFPDTMITKTIEPSLDVTVKYDCKASQYCNVFLRCKYPSMLTIYVGGWENSACGIAYNNSVPGPYLMKHDTGPVLSPTEFNTFTVHYNNGIVTVFRNDDVEPIYDVILEKLLPPITSVGIGSLGWGSWKSVRVARYDPGWRTDTWKTDGIGFSNMAVIE